VSLRDDHQPALVTGGEIAEAEGRLSAPACPVDEPPAIRTGLGAHSPTDVARATDGLARAQIERIELCVLAGRGVPDLVRTHEASAEMVRRTAAAPLLGGAAPRQ